MKSDVTTARNPALLGAVYISTLLLAACANQARNTGGVTVPPPLPAQVVQDLHWGVTVPDPYRFLEDVKNPHVQQWMRAQADATSAVLGRIPERQVLLNRIKVIEVGAGGNVSSKVSSAVMSSPPPCFGAPRARAWSMAMPRIARAA